MFAVGYRMFYVSGVTNTESVLAPACTVDAGLTQVGSLAYDLFCFSHGRIFLLLKWDSNI